MKKIFEKGDRVFCILGGWGRVIAINIGDYPISVEFDRNNYIYSEDGRVNDHTPPTLSFTEYTLEGFSQERPEILPQKDDIVWVRDSKNEKWRISHFVKKRDDGKYMTSGYVGDSQGLDWAEMTTKNPYK